MKNQIKISVVIPVYNTEEYLGRCLDSLYLQKFRNIEYIIVDDGSTDGSLELCKSYAKKDERFVVISKENGGPSSARNLAISKAKGEYITFVDSDDFVNIDAYERINQLLINNNNPDILIFGANLIPEYAPQYLWDKVSPRNVVYQNFKPEILFNEVGARPFLWLQVIKKTIISENNIKMDESINLGEDQLFQMQVFPKCNTFVFVDDKIYNYRWQRTNSLMQLHSDDKINKLILHVELVKKVFKSIFTSDNTEDLKVHALVWSIFFLYDDLSNLLEVNQQLVAEKLFKVWTEFHYERYLSKIDYWGQARLNQIKLMAESDKDKRIEEFEKANNELKEKIAELKNTAEYKKIEKKLFKKPSLMKKVISNIKENGFKTTFKKIIKKLHK